MSPDSKMTLSEHSDAPQFNSFDLIKQIEEPRISTCSFFVYTIDENSELSFLLRSKQVDSKQLGMYMDFGTTLRESEPNILFSAARSFIDKTAGLCVPSEFTNLQLPLEIKRILRESLNKGQLNIYTNSKVREILNQFVNNQLSVVMEVLGESHLALFVPMAYFQVEPLNIVLSEEMEATKYQDLSFHWMPLSQIINP